MLTRLKEARLADLAEAQHGVWSHAQARQLGLGKTSIHRRMKSRQWAEVLPGVFRHGSTPEGWLLNVHAAVLWGGEGAVASHRTAAALWGFDGFPRVPVEISSLRARQPLDRGLIMHRQGRLPSEAVTRSWGIPVTRPARTVVDLATVLEGDAAVEAAVDAAFRSGKVTERQIRAVLERVPERRRGVAVLRRVLERRRGTLVRTDSPAEMRLLRLLVAGGLPAPEARYEMKAGNEVVARIDLAYPKAKLAIEYDGYRHHSSRLEWSRDQSRANELVRRGWRVLRFTADDLRRPEQVCAAVWEALGARRRPRQLLAEV